MDDEIKIDKGVPLPPPRGKYPYARMEVGESCFIPGITQYGVGLQHLKPKKFARHVVTENGVRGVRVWRVE
jgi:hypothetical protein